MFSITEQQYSLTEIFNGIYNTMDQINIEFDLFGTFLDSTAVLHQINNVSF